MSGTDNAYQASHCSRIGCSLSLPAPLSRCLPLCDVYAMSGTDIAYGGSACAMSGADIAYAATGCPVLTYRTVLPGHEEMCKAAIRYYVRYISPGAPGTLT
eukprot:86079-Rhodomonas_salina.1